MSLSTSLTMQTISYRLFNKFIANKSDKKITNSKNFIKENVLIINSDFIKTDILRTINQLLNIDFSIFDTFYSNYQEIELKDEDEILIDKLLHYISTYGINAETAYMPEMKDDLINFGILTDSLELNLQKFSTYLSLKENKNKKFPEHIYVFDTLSENDFMEKLTKILLSQKAISRSILNLLKEVVSLIPNKDYIYENTQNKDVKRLFSIYYDVEDPEEFLFSLVYYVTDEVTIVKNEELYSKIINNFKLEHYMTLSKYFNSHKKELASIFNRNKFIFLAMKLASKNINKADTSIFNKISKLAKKYHAPKKDINIVNLDTKEFKNSLKGLNIYNVIKIANSLLYDINLIEADNFNKIFYIRNGKVFLRDYLKSKIELYKKTKEMLNSLNLINIDSHHEKNAIELYKKTRVYKLEDKKEKLSIAKQIIKSRISEIECERKYDFVNYALPTSEKRAFEGIPDGSTINFNNKDIIFGIYWKNVNNIRVDLDFSAQNAYSKVGWNANYKDNENKVIFSGDITDAPNGATELIYFKEYRDIIYKLSLNYYNYGDNVDKVPFKFFIANAKYFDSDFNDDIENYLNSKNISNASEDYFKDYKYIESEILSETPEINLGIIDSNTFTFLTSLSNKNISTKIDKDNYFDSFIIKSRSFLKFSDF